MRGGVGRALGHSISKMLYVCIRWAIADNVAGGDGGVSLLSLEVASGDGGFRVENTQVLRRKHGTFSLELFTVGFD